MSVVINTSLDLKVPKLRRIWMPACNQAQTMRHKFDGGEHWGNFLTHQTTQLRIQFAFCANCFLGEAGLMHGRFKHDN